MSDDPAAWLTARLDALERIAQGAIHQGGRGCAGEAVWNVVDPERMPGLIGDDRGEVVTHERRIGGPNRWRAEHIVANDPRSVLARVEADRKILARHVPMPATHWCAYCDQPAAPADWPCPDLMDVLSAHRHAAGFKEEWLNG